MTQDQIQALKQGISIVQYLSKKGIEPQNQSGSSYFYFSPLRNEKTPSFVVNTQNNLFNDFGGIGGDVIRLVQVMEKLSFPQALEFLQKLSGSPQTFSLAENINPKPTHESRTKLLSVEPLKNMNLIRYIQSRCISFNLANRYLKEVHYEDNQSQKKYYGIGFKNDSSGYAIRTEKISRSIAPNGITTIEGTNKTALNVFEGFFDFLSALEYYKVQTPTNTTVILNSVSNINGLILSPTSYNTINSYLDNDKAGLNALMVLKNTLNKACVTNYSERLHPNHKDFNEFLQNMSISSHLQKNSLITC